MHICVMNLSLYLDHHIRDCQQWRQRTCRNKQGNIPKDESCFRIPLDAISRAVIIRHVKLFLSLCDVF
jgi:hypothetical protein